MENKLIPYQGTECIDASSIIVFAPHPDDEVFGCGGAIMRHVANAVPVYVVIVSDGAFGTEGDKKAEIVSKREAESQKAATLLGYGAPEFWRLPDRGIVYGETLIQRIMEIIQLSTADLIYAPSLLEMHPDHRALAMSVIEAVRRSPSKPQLALYEVGVPLHPNLLLDISDLADRKKLAMECFVSQNQLQRYDLDIAALNRYRTYTLPANVTAAEAYLLVSADELITDPFKLYQSEHQRQRALGLALNNTDLPLVSVIIRSMDRHTLSEALDSVALQTYPNIEVVVIAAIGSRHSAIGEVCGRYPLHLEFAPDGNSLSRPAAANLGLEKAIGQWLIFLDDDDLFDPDHITGLIQALHPHPQIMAAYAGVRVENEEGQITTLFNSPYDQRRLFASNFIPIHALLFSRRLIGLDGARFDENMAVYEDWDFWIQLSRRTSFLHINKISAVYRTSLGNSGLSSTINKHLQEETRERFYDKWRLLWTGHDINNLTQYLFEQGSVLMDIRMSGLEQSLADIGTDWTARGAVITQLEQALADQTSHIDFIETELIKHQNTFYGKCYSGLSRIYALLSNKKTLS
jgi:LmbE family N-acetylglucosaminyl deacetylase